MYLGNSMMKRASQHLVLIAVATVMSAFSSMAISQEDAADGQPKYIETKKESSKVALGIFEDAAGLQNGGKFNIAEEEWQAFLEDHETDPLAPQVAYFLGVCRIQLGKIKTAATAFEQALKYKPFELTEQAYLQLGWCSYQVAVNTKDADAQQQQLRKAVDVFDKQLAAYEKSDFSDEALYFQGESYYALGDTANAEVSYQKLVDGFPKSELVLEAMYALGTVLEEQKKFPQAKQIYTKFLDTAGDKHELFTEVRMRLAETFLQEESYEQAAEIFGEVASVDGFASSDHALFRMAFCQVQLKDLDSAAETYGQLAESFSDSQYANESNLLVGRIRYQQKDHEAANAAFSKVVEQGGAFAIEAKHWQCRILLAAGSNDEALALATEAIANAGDSEFLVNLKMNQADAQVAKGNHEEARKLYLAILNDHADNTLSADALYNAVFSAYQLALHEEVIVDGTRFSEKFGSHNLLPDVQHLVAESQLTLKQYETAEATLRKLVENHPDHPKHENWTVRIAASLYVQKKYEDVTSYIDGVNESIESAQGKAEAHYLAGASSFFLKQDEPALTKLNESLAASPGGNYADDALLFISRIHANAEKYDEAVKTASKLIDTFESSNVIDQAHFRRGDFLNDSKQYDKAIEDYQVVIERFPNSVYLVPSLYGKAWCELRLDKHETSVATFTVVIDNHAQHELHPASLLGRLICRHQLDEFDGVVEDANTVLKSTADNAIKMEAVYQRGLAEVALEKNEAVVASFTSLLEDYPKFDRIDSVLYELGWAYGELEETEKSIGMFDRVAKEFPQSQFLADSHFRVAESLYSDEKYADAVTRYEASLAADPSDSLKENVIHKLGWAFYQQDEFAKAQEQFESQIKAFAEGTQALQGRFMNAECLHKLGDFEKALAVFEQFDASELESAQMKTLAWLHAGQAASQLKQYDKALVSLNLVVENSGEPSEFDARYEIGWILHRQMKYDDAVKQYEQVARGSRGGVGARARFMIGEISFAKQDLEDAVKQFQRVMFGFGGEKAVAAVKVWQSKAAMEAGRSMEVQVEDAKTKQDRDGLVKSAVEFYTYVVEKHPMSSSVEFARKRLEALSKL